MVRIALVGLLLIPAPAAANFFWPPALYYYSFTRWYVVVGGLAVEAGVYAVWLGLPVRRALAVSLVTNAVSASLGFVALWPVMFYSQGIELAMRLFGGGSILLVVGLLIVLNICLEYLVAVLWHGLPRTGVVLANIVAANLLSSVLLVALLPTWFKPF